MPAGFDTQADSDQRAADDRDQTPRTAWAYRLRGFRVLPWLVAAAIMLRVVATVVFHQFLIRRTGDPFFNLDERGYDRVAWAQAQAWHGIGNGVPLRDAYLLNAYTYAQSAMYWLVGHHPLAIKLVNAALGGVVVGLVFLIAWRLFNPAAALASGIMAMLFPSTLLWSTTGLKDSMFLAAVMLVLWTVTEFIASRQPYWLLPFFVAFAWLGGVRDYIQAMMGVIVPVSVALQPARFPRKWAAVAIIVIGCALLLWLGGGSQWFGVSPARLNQQRSCAAVNAESSFVGEDNAQLIEECANPVAMEDDTSLIGGSLREIIAWVPRGAFHVLAAPFPWAAERTVERATIPDTLCWYVAVILALVALWRTWVGQWRSYIYLVGYICAVGLVLALTQGNLGTLARHRGMIIPAVLIFSGYGLLVMTRICLARRIGLTRSVYQPENGNQS